MSFTISKSYLKGRRFVVERTLNGMAIEDIPTFRNQLYTAFGQDQVKESLEAFSLKDGRFWMKPKLSKREIGTLTCRPTFMRMGTLRIDYDSVVEWGVGMFVTRFATYTIKEAL